MAHVAFVVEKPARERTTNSSEGNSIELYTPSYITLVANALIKKGHTIDVYNNAQEEITLKGIRYRPIKKDKQQNYADLVIVHNSAKDLRHFTFNRAAIWQHNRTSFYKAWKRKEFIELFLYRPDIICLSNDALIKTPSLLPYRRRHIIPHAIDDPYLQAANSSTDGRALRAYFASRPSRNLDFLIQSWEQYVHPILPKAELIICCPKSKKPFPFDTERLLQSNINYIGSLKQNELINMAKSSRMLCYPGHINETGCRVALDAIGLNLPIITCGIGSLKDLVINKKTGFIENTKEAYAKRIIECMSNDELWESLSLATNTHPWRLSYEENIKLWEEAFDLK